jgi:hypothetical protein
MARLMVALAILSLSLLTVACVPQRACTMEAMVCPDGSNVGRSGPDCAFAPCPDVQRCSGAEGAPACPEGYGCYAFEGEEPSCYAGDPCVRCGGEDCRVMESYPAQVACG